MKKEKKPKQKKPTNLKTWLVPRLRRLSMQWPPKNEAKRLARRSRGQYECAHCHNLFKPYEVDMDHISPVVDPTEGYITIGNYIESLLVPIESYQCLCEPCHEIKTQSENLIRNSKKVLDSK